MGPNLFMGHHVMAWKKNYVYGPVLNYKIYQMQQSGVIHGIWQKYKLDPPGVINNE